MRTRTGGFSFIQLEGNKLTATLVVISRSRYRKLYPPRLGVTLLRDSGEVTIAVDIDDPILICWFFGDWSESSGSIGRTVGAKYQKTGELTVAGPSSIGGIKNDTPFDRMRVPGG